MILSTQTDRVFSILGEDRGLEVFANAGYDAIDFSMFGMTGDSCYLNNCDEEEYAKKLRAKAEKLGLFFNQAHAPFPSMKYGNEEYNKIMPERTIKAIKIAGLLGARQIIVHPFATPEGEQAQKKANIDFYKRLEPYALEYGIKIALENMWGWDPVAKKIIPNVCSFGRDLADYYDALDNPDAFTVCLDLGHCGLVGEETADAIMALGHDRLGALHVHDNDNLNDTHTLPYSLGGKMKWDNITKALSDINYKGEFTFEADNFLSRFPKEELQTAVNFMAQIGRGLIARCENR